MENGYRISQKDLNDFYESYKTNENIKINIEDKYELDLKKFLKSEKKLDGDELVNLFFPDNEYYDIFISHSHSEANKASVLANFLEKLGLKVFLDSKIWKSADSLLKEIDYEYCYNKESRLYDYDKRNFSTSHVHLLLASAIGNVINNSKIFIFLESSSSIRLDENSSTFVNSPWIYQELKYFEIIMKNKAILYAEFEKFGVENSLEIERNVDLNKLLRYLKKETLESFTSKGKTEILNILIKKR